MYRILIITAALAGCAVVPTTTTTVRTIRTESATVERPDVTHVVDAAIENGSLAVRAIKKGTCDRQEIAVEEHASEKHAKFRTPKDPRGGIIAFVLAPVTIPLSAAYTGLAVAGSGSRRTERRVVKSEPFACTAVAPSLPVLVTLPSGRVVERETNDRGELAFAIPPTEPYRGTVLVAAGHARATVEYAQPVPPITALREAVRSCATHKRLAGSIGLVVDVSAAGKATAAVDDSNADLGPCITTALATVQFPPADHDVRLRLRLAL